MDKYQINCDLQKGKIFLRKKEAFVKEQKKRKREILKPVWCKILEKEKRAKEKEKFSKLNVKFQ